MSKRKRLPAAGSRGAGILAMDLNTGKVLVGRRAKDGIYTGSICHFGGGVEHQEPPLDAAIREFIEETGWCRCGGMEIEYLHTNITSGGRMFYYHYLGITNGMFETKLNWEHSSAGWVNVERLFEFEDEMHPLFADMWLRRCHYIVERRDEILSFSGR